MREAGLSTLRLLGQWESRWSECVVALGDDEVARLNSRHVTASDLLQSISSCCLPRTDSCS